CPPRPPYASSCIRQTPSSSSAGEPSARPRSASVRSSTPPPPGSPPFPYTTLFRSLAPDQPPPGPAVASGRGRDAAAGRGRPPQRSEEHTSELQSRVELVCRLLLDKKTSKRPCKTRISASSAAGCTHRDRCPASRRL